MGVFDSHTLPPNHSISTTHALLSLLLGLPCIGQTADRGIISESSDFVPVPEQIRLSEILISIPPPCDPAQVAEAQRVAERLRDRIQQGESFADLARANSQGPTAATGGDIGYFKRGILAPSLEELAFRMHVGDISPVVRTKQGFVILKVTDHLEPLEATAEFKAYVENVKARVLARWYEHIPKSARYPAEKQGSVTVEFSIRHNGHIQDQRVAVSSGYVDLDKAALKAVRKAGPFAPLPKLINVDSVPMRLHFQYNPAQTTDHAP